MSRMIQGQLSIDDAVPDYVESLRRCCSWIADKYGAATTSEAFVSILFYEFGPDDAWERARAIRSVDGRMALPGYDYRDLEATIRYREGSAESVRRRDAAARSGATKEEVRAIE